MLYMLCPTCGELLGNKQLDCEEKIKKICDSDISDEEKKLKIRDVYCGYGLSPCCFLRLGFYVKKIDIIK